MVCKRKNIRHDKSPGLLQPLPILDRPWQHISIDFRSFPKDKKRFNTVLIIVDCLTKRHVSIPCHKTVTAQETARLFIQHVYAWTGSPDSIVSDRGP
jgi:hypothetical protein